MPLGHGIFQPLEDDGPVSRDRRSALFSQTLSGSAPKIAYQPFRKFLRCTPYPRSTDSCMLPAFLSSLRPAMNYAE